MFKSAIFLVIGALALSSCASKVHRGVVAMKIDETTAHVGLKSNVVAVGDHVELYGNKCTKNKIETGQGCTKYSKGHGVVSSILNEDYSVIKFDDGVKFQEGDFVEKHAH
ncbi:MAG: hypothetical protein H7235_04130 [Bdellovibrionaceae bacterium]|nr:hypothetical protein [Pseudobdellovibrionaceae bacterium]